MGLETFSYITSLNTSNPVHATDNVSQGDDHLRGIKLAVTQSFPNINAAVNFTPTEGNYLVGVTSLIQTQINGKAATVHTHATTDITSGTFADARIAESNVTQHEAALSVTESQVSDLGTYLSDNDQITTLEVGAATDTTLGRKAAGTLAVEGDAVFSHDSATYTSAKIFFSDTTEPTTEGSNGDIFLVY